MNLDKIEKLVKIIEESSLQEFSIQEGDIKIKMSKRAGESIAVPFAPGYGNAGCRNCCTGSCYCR